MPQTAVMGNPPSHKGRRKWMVALVDMNKEEWKVALEEDRGKTVERQERRPMKNICQILKRIAKGRL